MPTAIAGAGLVVALAAGAAGGIVGFNLADGGGGSSQLTENGQTLSDVAAAVRPSVVSIATETTEGSGVVYDDEGHIITNNHVAASARGGSLQVSFSDGTSARGEVVGADPSGDLAVIKVDVPGLTPISIGDSSDLAVGDTVLAIGSPLGLAGSVSSGIVSALDRTIQAGDGSPSGQVTTLNGLIQTDAAINPGNSGGALVNGGGELVGINTAAATADGSEGSVGLGFAIPSSTVLSTVDQLIGGGEVERAFFGVSVTDVSGGEGALVTGVQEDSPADEAGIEQGDVILELDGEQVAAAADLVSTVQSHRPGETMAVTFSRNGGEPTTVDVELAATG
ncbi:S1C family serine protease [Stackebrandtia soli]|uniref:S1C family serine protease n=1 Tax=Stackebrandtia soli TaxID=1892856 RepID=UPI0039E9A4B7